MKVKLSDIVDRKNTSIAFRHGEAQLSKRKSKNYKAPCLNGGQFYYSDKFLSQRPAMIQELHSGFRE